MMAPLKPRVRYARSPDGTALAWTSTGNGPPLVKVASWLTPIENDLESPVWSHWARFLSEHFRYIRYDERGFGLSDRCVGVLRFEHWVEDLEAAVEAAAIEEPFILLGLGKGAPTAIAYAARHPERVSRLILFEGYARGWRHRGDNRAEMYESILKVFVHGSSSGDEVFRELVTKRILPGGSEAQIRWLNELCRTTMSPEVASAMFNLRADIDVSGLLSRVSTPTLILNSTRNDITPFSEARFLAGEMPDAELAALDSRNHVLLKHEPAWAQFKEAVLDFTGFAAPGVSRGASGLSVLSRREREILALICQAKSNPDIARVLNLSERTVRNHASNIYGKLGVKSRTETMLHFSGLAP